MGICYVFWEETPERVEYYLNNHEWQSRVGLHLRFFDMGKAWRILHDLVCPAEMRHSFPENFIVNGDPLPNYENDSECDEDTAEFKRPFLYSVEKTRAISKFLESLGKDKLRQSCTREFWIANGFSGEYTREEEEDGFHNLYHLFEQQQRFFQRIASNHHCVVGRKS